MLLSDNDKQNAIRVPISDVGGFFIGTEVEAALQETGTHIATASLHDAKARRVTVALTGGDFTSIQAAIDSITVGAGEKWAVAIFPGTYIENVILKDGISLYGTGTAGTTIIKATTGDVLTLGISGFPSSVIENLTIRLTVTGLNTPHAVVSTLGVSIFTNVVFDIDVAGGHLDCLVFSGGIGVFNNCSFQYNQTGLGGGRHAMIALSSTADINVLNGFLTMDIAAIATADYMLFIESSGIIDDSLHVSDLIADITASSASFDGKGEFVKILGPTTGNFVKNCHIHIMTPSGITNSLGTIYDLDNGAAGLRSTANQLTVMGFTVNYLAEITQAGDILDSHFDDADTPDEIVGIGLLNSVSSPTKGDLRVSGLLYGSTDAAGTLDIQGTRATDLGQINIHSPMVFDNMATAGVPIPLQYSSTFSTTAGFNGGFIVNNADVTVGNGFWIWALLAEVGTYRINVTPTFSAFTLFNALPTLVNLGNFNIPQALVLNAGPKHQRATAGTSTTVQTVGISFSPQTKTSISGAVMTKTVGDTAIRVSPTFSTVTGSTVNLGTTTGMVCVPPGVALFQSATGVENFGGYVGLDFQAMTHVTSSDKVVVRSAMTDAVDRFFLQNNGGARSAFGGGELQDVGQILQPTDLVGRTLGAGSDWQDGWGVSNFYFMQFNALSGQFRISNPTATRFLFNDSTGAGEFNFNCARFSLGVQTGANGNTKGNFVAGAETVTAAGDFSQFLLTQIANDTINAALGLYAGWTVNAPSPALGTGSLTTVSGLNIIGNPTGATVNRVGLYIQSNPAGGSGINAALWVTAGRSRFDGIVDLNKPIVLGGGAAATLGTIGGTGPTVAAQAQWVQIEVNGINHWVPAWI